MMTLYITNFWKHGDGLSGGDTIANELGKRFPSQTVFCQSKKTNLKHGIWDCIERTWEGLNHWTQYVSCDIVYSSSDFYPDLLPALMLKRRGKAKKWIAGYYLVAPPPFAPRSPYKGYLAWRGLLYWLTQRLSLWAVNKWADIVFVTSEPDLKYFPKKKVIVVRGGVCQFGTRNTNPKYDAVYLGRFHYQKGVLELMDIWKEVCNQHRTAKLVMIGDGPLKEKVLAKRHKLGLELNVELVGSKTGEEKYDFIKNSRIVVHPANFDSGGFSCAEAMAFGLPAVGFALEAFKTYYPKGMIQVKTNTGFARAILLLLKNYFVYETMSKEAKDLTLEQWDWDKQAERIWKKALS